MGSDHMPTFPNIRGRTKSPEEPIGIDGLLWLAQPFQPLTTGIFVKIDLRS